MLLLQSPLSVVLLTGVLTAITLLISRPATATHNHQLQALHETLPSPIAKQALPRVSVDHKFIGSGLKRDYQIVLDIPKALLRKKREYTLRIDMPKSLIVDEFRLNRLRVNGVDGEAYKCDAVVDLESGVWAETSKPYVLEMTFNYPSTKSDANSITITIPEMMARYHLPDDHCFHLPAPTVSIVGVDVDNSSGAPLRQCVPVSPPSLIVPIMTVLTPIVSCVYLMRLIRKSV